jgi:hypothetical protein
MAVNSDGKLSAELESAARIKMRDQKPVDNINPITQPEFSVMQSSLAFAMDAGPACPALQLTRPKLVFRTELVLGQ